MFKKMNMRIKDFETGKWIVDEQSIIDAMNEVIQGSKNYSMNTNTVYQTIDYIEYLTTEAIQSNNEEIAREGKEILRQLNY